MLRSTKEWDVRCPKALVKMFPVRRGYYYKVNRKQARKIVSILSKAYGMQPYGAHPITVEISPDSPERPNNGECYYLPEGRSRIHVHARGHMKTVFHEWYHALDHYTGGKYNSDDRRGGPSSLAWQFADRLFEIFRRSY